MDKKIILTYDYELFLGSDSGNLENTLINPTSDILNMLDKYHKKALFFIDSTFLLHILDSKCFFLVKKQIQEIKKQGHDIGLHLHPHWIDSKNLEECRWRFDEYKHFRLHSFSDLKIKEIVQDSYALLSSIVKEIDESYKIDSFRAGGWSIQPFNRLKDVFFKLGIKYDFSVLPNMRDDDKPRHYYDFKDAPKNFIWRFEDDILLEEKNGKFIEISNTVFNMNIIDLIKNKKLIKNYKIVGDGRGAGRKKSFFEQLKRIRWNIPQILSSDSLDFDIFKKYVKNIDREIIVYVAHPKLFSNNSFKVLEYICLNYKIIKYKDIKV